MCTVSLVPHPDSLNGFVLTSNRDEAVSRNTLAPEKRRFRGVQMYYPMDEKAGGTWIGVSEFQRCICLMNGADKPHAREPEYRKSRGVVVKEFLAARKIKPYLKSYNYEGIEPFTMIIVDWYKGLAFFELLWDGQEYRFKKLPFREHIWSSSPLYSEEMKALREQWFQELKKSKGYKPESILDFHHNAGEGNLEHDLIIDRGFLKTQSISQIHNSKSDLKFWYKNLKNNEVVEDYLQFRA
ncbi:NRDE family protein [Gramella sp. GC03-9]|uniref:NRDE family protein n=1 Tax=Christiangramia oceanisediminis TaxID=2920386 RepID=A0A9X2KVH7_9FLAO|nr:NRDE family protein [Gramella oceanisediminis]MCP9198448.1 NRDE family protein [Gramella oceanisediminis]